MTQIMKEQLTFDEIKYLHSSEFEYLCSLYDEQALWDILQSGAEWKFWPENVIMHLNFSKSAEGVPEMIQLGPEAMKALKEAGEDEELVVD